MVDTTNLTMSLRGAFVATKQSPPEGWDCFVGLKPSSQLHKHNGGIMQEVTDVQRLSKRVAGLKPSGIRKFFDIAATMKDVISLGIGEPDFTPPKPILEAGIRSLHEGETHYTSNWGKME